MLTERNISSLIVERLYVVVEGANMPVACSYFDFKAVLGAYADLIAKTGC